MEYLFYDHPYYSNGVNTLFWTFWNGERIERKTETAIKHFIHRQKSPFIIRN